MRPKHSDYSPGLPVIRVMPQLGSMTINELAMKLLKRPQAALMHYLGNGRAIVEPLRQDNQRQLFNDLAERGVVTDIKVLRLSSGRVAVCRTPMFLVDDLGQKLVGPTIGKVVKGVGLYFDFNKRPTISEVSLDEVLLCLPADYNQPPAFETAFSKRVNHKPGLKKPKKKSPEFVDTLEQNAPQVPILRGKR